MKLNRNRSNNVPFPIKLEWMDGYFLNAQVCRGPCKSVILGMNPEDVLYDLSLIGNWPADYVAKDYSHCDLRFSNKAQIMEWCSDWEFSLSPDKNFLVILKMCSLEILSFSSSYRKADFVYPLPIELTKSSKRFLGWSSDSKFILISFSNGESIIATVDFSFLYRFRVRETDTAFGRVKNMFVPDDSYTVYAAFIAEETIHQQKLWKYRITFIFRDALVISMVFDRTLEDGGRILNCSEVPLKDIFILVTNSIKLSSSRYLILGVAKKDDLKDDYFETKLVSCDFNFFSSAVKNLKSLSIPTSTKERNTRLQEMVKHIWNNSGTELKRRYYLHCSPNEKFATIQVEEEILYLIDLSSVTLKRSFSPLQLRNLSPQSSKVNEVKITSHSWWTGDLVIVGFSDSVVSLIDLNDIQSYYSDVIDDSHAVVFAVETDLQGKISFLFKKLGKKIRFPLDSSKLIDLSKGRETDYKTSLDAVLRPSKLSTVTKFILYPFIFLTDTLLWNFDSESWMPKYEELIIPKYQILTLFKTTPLDFYLKKIAEKSFAEAFELADKYNFNTDEIYKALWIEAPVSEISINDYLSKIKDTLWVLNSCLDRSTELPSSLRLLLSYGLKISEEASKSILQKFDENTKDIIQKCGEIVNVVKRLDTFEALLDVDTEIFSGQRFSIIFKEFCKKDLVDIAKSFAKEMKFKSLTVIFNRHFAEIFLARYEILNSIPETASPEKFSHLLPTVIDDAEKFLDFDIDILGLDIPQFPQLSESKYDPVPFPLPRGDIVSWYQSRIFEVDKRTGLIELLFEWIKIAKMKCHFDFEDLDESLNNYSRFVYFCEENSSLFLEDFLKIPDELLASHYFLHSSTSNIEDTFLKIIIPLLRRKEPPISEKELAAIVSKLIKDVCTLKFDLCLTLLKTSSVITNQENRFEIVIGCIYNLDNQIEQVERFLDLLKSLKTDITDNEQERDLLYILADVKKILLKNGLKYSLKDLRLHIADNEFKKAVTLEMIEKFNHKQAKDADWLNLFNDILFFRRTYAKTIDLKFFLTSFIKRILISGNFTLANTILYPRKGEKILSDHIVEEMVLKCSFYFIDCAEDCNDTECLKLAKNWYPYY